MLWDGDETSYDIVSEAFYAWQMIEGMTEEMFLPILEEYLERHDPEEVAAESRQLPR